MQLSKEKFYPILWLPLAMLVLAIDFVTGPIVQFPIAYVIPVALAAWFSGLFWGLLYAIVLPLVRLLFSTIWVLPWAMTEASINCAIRMIVLALLAFLVDRIRRDRQKLQKKVATLEGFLPICAFCKKIRDDKQDWQPLENYIQKHSEAVFSHGFCPECEQKHYGEYLQRGSNNR